MGIGPIRLVMPVMNDAEISRAADWRFRPGRVYPRKWNSVGRDAKPLVVLVMDGLDLDAVASPL